MIKVLVWLTIQTQTEMKKKKYYTLLKDIKSAINEVAQTGCSQLLHEHVNMWGSVKEDVFWRSNKCVCQQKTVSSHEKEVTFHFSSNATAFQNRFRFVCLFWVFLGGKSRASPPSKFQSQEMCCAWHTAKNPAYVSCSSVFNVWHDEYVAITRTHKLYMSVWKAVGPNYPTACKPNRSAAGLTSSSSTLEFPSKTDVYVLFFLNCITLVTQYELFSLRPGFRWLWIESLLKALVTPLILDTCGIVDALTQIFCVWVF